jgi:hypothetical protein
MAIAYNDNCGTYNSSQSCWQHSWEVLKSSTPVELDVVEAFNLESMGLVNLQGNLAMVSCDLFRQ